MIYTFFYRSLMKLAHRFNWHYAPEIGPLEDGRTQLWCKWCGFRMMVGNPINEELLKSRKTYTPKISEIETRGVQ